MEIIKIRIILISVENNSATTTYNLHLYLKGEVMEISILKGTDMDKAHVILINLIYSCCKLTRATIRRITVMSPFVATEECVMEYQCSLRWRIGVKVCSNGLCGGCGL